MKIADHYKTERDDTETTDERKAVFRAYYLALKTQIDARGLGPEDPLRWRTAAMDKGLPTPYMPAWTAMSGEDLLQLYDVLSRARSAGED